MIFCRSKVVALLISQIVAPFAFASSQQSKSLIENIGSGVSSSVIVVRVADGASLFEHEPDQLLSPASVTKIITSATALTRFTPVHSFTTKTYITGKNNGGKVDGDLIVVGDGDPLLVSEKLWQFAADVRNAGITAINGNIIIDNSLFGDEARDRSRKSGENATTHAYDAPVSAFGVNFNTIAVVITPGAQVGKPAIVGTDPYPLRHVVLENKVLTTKGNGSNLQVKRVGDENSVPRFEVTGSIGIDGQQKKVYRSIADYVQTSGEYIRAFLAAAGVRVAGEVREGAKPVNAQLLFEIGGYDLRRITQGLNTFSNNYLADVVLKRLGAAFPVQGQPNSRGQGTFSNGLAVINDFLVRDVGIKSKFVLANGSGLDTANRLSARQVVDVLRFMERRMDVFPDFLGGLPAYGWDGTLKKRAKSGDLAQIHGLVRAKTGTLSEPITVVSLAGYLRHRTHGLIAFAVLQNGVKGRTQPGIADLRDLQDELVATFLQLN